MIPYFSLARIRKIQERFLPPPAPIMTAVKKQTTALVPTDVVKKQTTALVPTEKIISAQEFEELIASRSGMETLMKSNRLPPAFMAIRGESFRHRLPKAFVKDLYEHDLRNIYQYPQSSFFWFLGENGTNMMMWPGTWENNLQHCRRVFNEFYRSAAMREATKRTYRDNRAGIRSAGDTYAKQHPKHVYYWNGEKLVLWPTNPDLDKNFAWAWDTPCGPWPF